MKNVPLYQGGLAVLFNHPRSFRRYAHEAVRERRDTYLPTISADQTLATNRVTKHSHLLLWDRYLTLTFSPVYTVKEFD